MVTASLLKELTITVLRHEVFELLKMLGLQRPDLLQNVEVNGLGARRSCQRSFVSPPVVHIGVLHHIGQLNLTN